MMEKLLRSWSIFQSSMVLIRQEKKLLLFPILSAVILLLLLLLVAFAGGVTSFFASASETAAAAPAAPEAGDPEAIHIAEVVFIFLLYLLMVTAANFCNVAFYSEIIRGLYGEPVSILHGFRFACSRFKAIVLWSALAATVGIILRTLEKRSGLFGAIALKLIGVVWAVASCFAIPVLVCDENLNNPIEALRRSASAIRRTWGESLIGFLGLQSLSFLVAILFVVFNAGIIFCAGRIGGTVGLYFYFLIPVTILAAVIFFYLISVAQQVYQAALYLYAQGEEIDCFDEAVLEYAFQRKE